MHYVGELNLKNCLAEKAKTERITLSGATHSVKYGMYYIPGNRVPYFNIAVDYCEWHEGLA